MIKKKPNVNLTSSFINQSTHVVADKSHDNTHNIYSCD